MYVEKGWEVYFHGWRKEKSCPLISTIKASKLLCQGCIEYWCHAIDIQKKEETTKDIPKGWEFGDAFPKNHQDYLASKRNCLQFELALKA